MFHVCNSGTNRFGLHLIFHRFDFIKIRKTLVDGTITDELIRYYTEIGDFLQIAINFIDEQQVELFIDGYKIFSGNVGSVPYSGIGIGIGRNVTADANQRQSTNGVFLWNKKLTEIEATELTSSASFKELATTLNYDIV